jgi:hypothetical protein
MNIRSEVKNELISSSKTQYATLDDVGALKRISDFLRDLTHVEQRLRALEEPIAVNSDAMLLQHITAVVKSRRVRDKLMPSEIFADPAWDIILDLSIARLNNQKTSVSSLCIAACVPTTTAFRRINKLLKKGHIEKICDPDDARRTFIFISDAMFDRVRNWSLMTSITVAFLISYECVVRWPDGLFANRTRR